MPPYSNRPTPKAKGLIVNVPLCEWCHLTTGFPCASCGRTTCYACLVNNEGGRCTHQAYTPVQSTGWGEVCKCTNEFGAGWCVECGGRGIIWNAQKR